MNGRTEHMLVIEKRISNFISDKPSLIKVFYNSMSVNTPETKYNYLTNVCDAFDIMYGKSNWDDATIVNTRTEKINEFFTQRQTTIVNDGVISSSKIATQHSALNSFFRCLKNLEYIKENPMDKATKRPKIVKKKQKIALTDEDVRIILDNVENGVGSNKAKAFQQKWKKMHIAIIHLFLSTGIRKEALREINISDIDFERRILTVIEKGGKKREIRINSDVMDYILDWMEDRKNILDESGVDTDALFITNKRGVQRIGPITVNNILNKYAEGTNKKISAHKFRHKAGTDVYRESGGDLLLTKEFLGHASVSTTQIYAVPDNEKMEEIVSRIHQKYKKE